MATNEQVLSHAHTLTNERAQRNTVIVEEGANGAAATFTYDHSASLAGLDGATPPRVELFTHDGGLTSTATETFNVSAGDTLEIEFRDPDNASNNPGSAWDLDAGAPFTKVTHSLAGGTDTAYTAVQVVASLNADAAFAAWGYAAVLAGSSTAVSIFPRGPVAEMKVVGGTGSSILAFPATVAKNAERVWTGATPDAAASYDAATGIVTVTGPTGATDKLAAHISFF